MALPPLSLDLASPSTAISHVDAGQNTANVFTGPFAVGAGASARQTNTLPVTNSNTRDPGAGGAALASMFGGSSSSLMLAGVIFIGILILKKKGVV